MLAPTDLDFEPVRKLARRNNGGSGCPHPLGCQKCLSILNFEFRLAAGYSNERTQGAKYLHLAAFLVFPAVPPLRVAVAFPGRWTGWIVTKLDRLGRDAIDVGTTVRTLSLVDKTAYDLEPYFLRPHLPKRLRLDG